MHHEHRRSGRTRAWAAPLALLAVAALLFSAPAAAHSKRHKHRKHKHQHHVRVYDGHGFHGHGRFAVPRVIARGHGRHYRSFYHGRAYYGPHRHHHAIYHFPVYRDHRYVYEPHYYCGDRLFHSGYVSYDGPRVGFHVRF